ncbi:MAG: NAD(P)-dependent oxidoreductase [Proteobacteria bacterium]|nr:NAD(P)-dependent oxidoreductase [Pseudomonadota bacterium]
MLEHLNKTASVPQRVVVIGSGGFVGSAIAARLASQGVSVEGLTRKEVDLLADDAATRLAGRLKDGDSVVFVSAIAPARNAAALMQNLRMAEAVVKGLTAKAPDHVIYISSDSVYADDASPVKESSSCQPATMHGMMHAARELVLKNEIKAPLALLRPSLLYGARDPHNGYGPNRFRRQAAKGEPITLFGNGEEQRDHVFIDDVAELVALTLRHRSRGILNIATGVSMSFRTIAEKVVALSGKSSDIDPSARHNAVTHRHFDVTSCLKAFPRFRYTPLDEGLKRAASEESGARP